MERFLKIGFGVLALGALIFGFIRLGQNLKLTFITSPTGKTEDSQKLLEETRLKVTDTDNDGLNDWEELNTYGTSPYLADSDSDGEPDSSELKSGADPNCPKGRECGTPAAGQTLPSLLPPGTAALNLGTGDSDEQLPLEDLKELSPDEIRALLKEGGVTDEQLQGVSDEELRKLLEEVVNAGSGNY